MGRVFVTLQYLLPHHLLCRLVYVLSRSQRRWLKNALIRAFVRHYRPQMAEALEPEPMRYQSFNAFFTRALKPGARPLPDTLSQLICPCDGILGQSGMLVEDELLQAKGHRYRLAELLATDEAAPENFRGGHYVTLYLAPYHYHRVHMPLDGTLRAAWHVPGRLFSVNAATCARVPRLFARNERVICLFDGHYGPFAVILVGALFVGSMSTVWHGEITPWRGASAMPPARAVHGLEAAGSVERFQARGAELGRFNMGSTVLLLLPPSNQGWQTTATLGEELRMGQPLAALGH